jgi:hypothetical protein
MVSESCHDSPKVTTEMSEHVLNESVHQESIVEKSLEEIKEMKEALRQREESINKSRENEPA